MEDDTTLCPYCENKVKIRNLEKHQKKKCPKSPLVAARNTDAGSLADSNKAIRAKPTHINVRSRLERLFRELEAELLPPDELGLAKEFKAFYEMYVRDGRSQRFRAARTFVVDDDGVRSESIRTFSGGLPSLGKRAK